MKNIQVVIGACFGDEGKGLMTDYLSAKAGEGLVVRFNGGAQAGHTVVTPEGKRHAFGHLGSGTLAGLPTYLSSFFVVNPLLFQKEYEDVAALTDSKPKVYIDRRCLVTTPYDMMVNQIVEIARGSARHGSCGVGFNETIVRSQRSDLQIFADELGDTDYLMGKLNEIRKTYVFRRLKDLGVNDIPEDFMRYFEDQGILHAYLRSVSMLLNSTEFISAPKVFNSHDSIVFEGAQGLLLDQNHGYFPHVTPSNTGMQNVRELLRQSYLEGEEVNINYMTRCYLTRHGAGPFPTETPDKPFPGIYDSTNICNDFQGPLRFGYLDIDLLSKSISRDLGYAEGLRYNHNIVVTCADQPEEGKLAFRANNRLVNGDIETMMSYIWDLCGTIQVYPSHGPTRKDIDFPVECKYDDGAPAPRASTM